MLSTSTDDKQPYLKSMTALALRRRLGIESHVSFWKRLDAMSDEEWTDEYGQNCRPVKLDKNYSFFMPNQIYCIYKKFGINIPRTN
jgi:hypothetical protein